MINRRQFTSVVASIAGTGIVDRISSLTAADPLSKPSSKLERIGIGGIGLRYQGSVDLHTANQFGDVVAVCDVDKNVRDQAKAAFGSRPQAFENYEDLLNSKNVDVVIIGTPDHWHVKMAMDAIRANKAVYLEKPLSLTIEEGKRLCDVVHQENGLLQVGSWQRSDSRFRLAVEMVHQGRIGKLKRVDVVLGKNQIGGPFKPRAVPGTLNWNLWQGQTPDVPYLEERCHYTFRWWYEYSGGQMTDWGAHHLDIAQWAIGANPISVDGVATFPDTDRGYNVAKDFKVTYTYPDNVIMTVADTGRNGILFTGDQGRIFVNRGVLSGKPVEDLKSNPLPREEFKAYDFDNLERKPRFGKLESIVNHMGNLFDCIEKNKTPISDVVSQHRSVSTCHIGNISMRLGRALRWTAGKQEFSNDSIANNWLRRDQRDGFETI